MLISPPFIPQPLAGEHDDAYINRAMQGGVPGDGAFPLSFDLNWHGGIHLTAPTDGTNYLPVRAIADATLAYFRQPTEEPSAPADHGLRYRGKWTDNGCIVLRHETEIGEGSSSKAVFYSIYMHLSKITIPNPQKGMAIYRKDTLGEAGRIYDKENRIHFEIIADQSQIAHLVGRDEKLLNHQTGNGRVDSCWGDIYFFIPPEVMAYETPPSNRYQADNRSPVTYRCPTMSTGTTVQEGSSAANGKAAEPTPLVHGYEWAVAHQLQEGIFIRMRYERGQCTLTSFLISGAEIGVHQEISDYEYNLYQTAAELYPQCPSAGYELLRFGRVLGPDPLRPTDAAHWRQIALPTRAGESTRIGWVNLNSATITKFSDADFPHWQGWKLIDDDTDSDSHCQSPTIRSLLRLDDGKLVSDQVDAVTIASSPTYASLSEEDKLKLSERYKSEKNQNEAALCRLDAQNQIKRLICKFPSEWCKDDFDTRYGWLRKVSPEGPLSEGDYNRLRKHHQALAFWEDAALADIDKKHWHLPPKEFISAFKKCGWISKEELHTILKQAPAPGKQRAEALRVPMNKMLTKYLINSSRLRMAHFFAQVGIETGWWRYRKELGGPEYFRTMYEIITPTEAGEHYDQAVLKKRDLPNGLRPEELPNPGPRKKTTTTRTSYVAERPAQVARKAAGMDNGVANALNGGQSGDGERFRGRGFLQITGRRNYTSYQKYRNMDFTTGQNPLLLASNDHNACDASGFYWAREKINKYADEGDTPETSKKVGSIINRGHPNKEPNHNAERQAAFSELWEELNESH